MANHLTPEELVEGARHRPRREVIKLCVAGGRPDLPGQDRQVPVPGSAPGKRADRPAQPRTRRRADDYADEGLRPARPCAAPTSAPAAGRFSAAGFAGLRLRVGRRRRARLRRLDARLERLHAGRSTGACSATGSGVGELLRRRASPRAAAVRSRAVRRSSAPSGRTSPARLSMIWRARSSSRLLARRARSTASSISACE